jgi:hypothetical protein
MRQEADRVQVGDWPRSKELGTKLLEKAGVEPAGTSCWESHAVMYGAVCLHMLITASEVGEYTDTLICPAAVHMAGEETVYTMVRCADGHVPERDSNFFVLLSCVSRVCSSPQACISSPERWDTVHLRGSSWAWNKVKFVKLLSIMRTLWIAEAGSLNMTGCQSRKHSSICEMSSLVHESKYLTYFVSS